MVSIWTFVSFCAAIVAVLFLVFIAESAIYAKIDELQSRKELKRLEKEYSKKLEESIDSTINKLFEDDKED